MKKQLLFRHSWKQLAYVFMMFLGTPLFVLGGPTKATEKNLFPAATDRNVSGKVKDEKGLAIPGANISIKGTNRGTTTDSEGAFRLSNVPDNAVLVVSSVGFISQELSLGSRTSFDIALKEDTQNLGELVVTALGIKKEAKTLGYATSTVGAEQISVNRTTNFVNALTGKIAGVSITSLGTGAAGTSKIRIRGQSSFSGQNSPLMVLNGVPIDKHQLWPELWQRRIRQFYRKP